MTLRTGNEKLWKPCKDCDKMIPRHAKTQQTCKDCKKKNMIEKIRKDVLRMERCSCGGFFKFKGKESCYRCVRKKSQMLRIRMRLLKNEING